MTCLARAHRSTVRALLLLSLLVGCADQSHLPPKLAWSPMNRGLRSHGPVLALLFDRLTPRRVLAGLDAEQSLFSSDDGGETWLPLAIEASPSGIPWSPPTYALLQPEGFPRVILAATGSGVYRSSDAGLHWESVGSELQSGPMYALASDQSGAVILAGGEGPTVHSSIDGGLSWQALSPLPAGGAVLSVAVSPDDDWLLAGTDGSGLFSSRDRGATWQRVDGVGETFVSSIVLGSAGLPPCAHDDCVLVRARSGLFAGLDGGLTWRKVDNSWDGRVDAITIGGAEPAWIVVTDRGRVYRSLSGEHWELWGAGLGRTGAVFSLASNPDQPAILVAGTENGLYSSSDGGLHWRPSTGGPGTPSADALALGSGGLLYLANLDGIYASVDGGATWDRRSQGLPQVPFLSLAVAPSAPNVVYAGASGAGLFRSNDGGLSWSVTGWDGASVPGIGVHPGDPDLLYFRVAFQRVYSSEDGGHSVQARWNGFTLFTEIMSLVIDDRRPERLYAGGTDRLYRSSDGGARWEPTGPELDGQTVYALAVSRSNQQRLLAAATKGVYVSLDEGVSWRRWGRGLEDVTVTALAQHPLRRELVFVGTKYGGIYRSGDGGRTWQHAGLGDLSVNALFVSPDGRWLYVATPQGFFRGEAR